MIIVETFVAGRAKTKGSMVVRNRTTGAMKESVIGSSNWRALVAAAVRDDIARRDPGGGVPGMMPWPGAAQVSLCAYLPPASGGPGNGLTWIWAVWARAGDLDKLTRNVLDALGSTSKNPKMNGGAILDDNLVCRIVAEKRVATEQQPAGLWLRVETL